MAVVCWSVSWRYRESASAPGWTRLSQCTAPAGGETTAKPLKTKTRVLSIRLQSCKQLHRSCCAGRSLAGSPPTAACAAQPRAETLPSCETWGASGWGAKLF